MLQLLINHIWLFIDYKDLFPTWSKDNMKLINKILKLKMTTNETEIILILRSNSFVSLNEQRE